MAMKTGVNGLAYLDLAKSAVERFIAFRKGYLRGHHRGDHYLLASTSFDYTCIKSIWEDGMETFMRKVKELCPVDLTNLENGIFRSFELLNQKRYRTNIDTLGFGRNTSKIVPSYVILLTDGSSFSSLEGGLNKGQPSLRDRLRKRSILKADVFRWDQKLHTIVLHIPPQTYPRNRDTPTKIKVTPDKEASINTLGELSLQTGGSLRVVGSLGEMMNHLNFLATGKFFGEISVTLKNINPPKKHHRNQYNEPLKVFRTINEKIGLNRISHQTWWPVPESHPIHQNMKEFPPRDGQPKLYVKFPFRVGEATPSDTIKKKSKSSSILDDSFLEKMTSDRYEIDQNTKIASFLKEFGCECQVFVRNSANDLSGGQDFRPHHHSRRHHHLHPHHPLHMNSQKPEHESLTKKKTRKYGEPIGFMKYEKIVSKCFLYLLPYNYPLLIRIFRQFAANNYILGSNLRSEFENYFRAVPFYYIHPLKQTLQKICGNHTHVNSLFKQTYHGIYTLPYFIDNLLKTARNEEKEREVLFRKRIHEIRYSYSRNRKKKHHHQHHHHQQQQMIQPPPPPSSSSSSRTKRGGRIDLGDFRKLFRGGDSKSVKLQKRKEKFGKDYSPTKKDDGNDGFSRNKGKSRSSTTSFHHHQQQQHGNMRRRVKDDIFSISRYELFEQIHTMKNIVKKLDKKNGELELEEEDDDEEEEEEEEEEGKKNDFFENRPFREYSDVELSNIFVDQHSISHEKMQNFTDHLRKKEFLRKHLIDDSPIKINFGNPYAPKKRKRQRSKGFLKSDEFEIFEDGEKKNRKLKGEDQRNDNDNSNNNNNVTGSGESSLVDEHSKDQVKSISNENEKTAFEMKKKMKKSKVGEDEKRSEEKKNKDDDEVSAENNNLITDDEDEDDDEDDNISGRKREREKSIEGELLEQLSFELSDISILEKKGSQVGQQNPPVLDMFQSFVFSELEFSNFEKSNKNEVVELRNIIKNPGNVDAERFVGEVEKLDGSERCKVRLVKNLMDLSNRFKRRKLSHALERYSGKMEIL